MSKSKSLKAKVDMSAARKVPERFYEIDEPASKADPKEIANRVLKKVADELQIDKDLSGLMFDQVRESILGSHVLFQQHQDGKAISGAWIRVDIDPEGKVFSIQNDLVPRKLMQKGLQAKVGKAAPSAITAEDAKAKAFEETGLQGNATAEVLETEELFLPVQGVPTEAWKVLLKSSSPATAWKVYVDAHSGQILDVTDLLKQQNGVGRVFYPNPVVTLNNTTLKDSSTIPDAAYREVTLLDLDGSGYLDGKYVTTRTTKNRVKRDALDFLFERQNRAFKEVMVYFHIDRVQRYYEELGFKNIRLTAIPADIDGDTRDNSYYDPTGETLTFGTGGVDDAEDAEIILHEFGHATQDAIVKYFGRSAEAKAMGEGFSDYLAASLFADVKPELLRPTVGNWDAVSYSGAEPPCLRRLDSNKIFPRDFQGQEHNDGEIWSACLWEIRNALGAMTADKLIIAHHYLLSPQATFEQAARAMITTDERLYDGRYEKVIRDVFVRRGILPNPNRKNKRAGVPFSEISIHNSAARKASKGGV